MRLRIWSLGLLLTACAEDVTEAPPPEVDMRPRHFAQVLLVPAPKPAELDEGKLGKLEGKKADGVSIRKKKAGGRAGAIDLGGAEVSGSGGAMITNGICGNPCPNAQHGFGGRSGYGIGLGGMGSGGSGYGVGSGLGHRALVSGRGGDGVGLRSSSTLNVDASPFAMAGIELPYKGGTPGKFEGRADAKIQREEKTEIDHFSTFAVDVDTAAYSIARRTIKAGGLPEPSLVRAEELINYFHYDYEAPTREGELFSIEADGARAPIDAERYLLRVGIQAKKLDAETRPPVNLVFLVDTSCSMTGDDRLELAKESLRIATRNLGPRDKVAISTYAGGVALVLAPTAATEIEVIDRAIDTLSNGGGTAMQSGMELAYSLAAKMKTPGAFTRVIVCSDGDANIGSQSPDEILAGIAGYRKKGITLSTIGFGDGNYQDSMMEKLANKGNGNYYYVDSPVQARRVFGRDLTKMIVEVAKDVKIQVELDGDAVKAYRLIGYENRAIADEDFRNDEVDAGEIGAGHQVTALYELTLQPRASGRLATIRLRAKRPDGEVARETALNVPVTLIDRPFAEAPSDLKFAAAVWGTSELLRKGEHSSDWTPDRVLELARAAARSDDPDRAELVALLEKVRPLLEARASRF